MGRAQSISLWQVGELPEERSFRESIRYSGRKAARAKSEQRRLQILEATLRIAARDGLKGIKHRAVAREAGVPLAATTYYFRDIGELISDSFMLFAEKAREELGRFYDTVNLVLDNVPEETLIRGGAGRAALATRLSAIATAYLAEQFTERREQMLAEQVFLMESLRDERLAGLARNYRSVWVAGLEQILHRLDSPAPARDASLLVNVVLGLGYDHLLNRRNADREALEEAVRRMVCLVLVV
ncbi:MAG: TetR/AcrR family transcriptional regulator [Pseudomonadota bacterium]